MYRNNAQHRGSDQVTVRRSTRADEPALFRLASLDSGPVPAGPALVAEAGSRIVAALPLDGGRPIADPFEPTAELLALLELRGAQLRASEPRPFRSPFLRLLGRFDVAAARKAA